MTTTSTLPPDKILARGLQDLIADDRLAFFAALVCRLEHRLDPAVPTACTDGRTARYNPALLTRICRNCVLAVLAHEAMHPALGHLWRRGSRDPQLWNMAADHAINLELRRVGLRFCCIAGVLADARFKDQPAERIYATLRHEQEQAGQPQQPYTDPLGGFSTPQDAEPEQDDDDEQDDEQEAPQDAQDGPQDDEQDTDDDETADDDETGGDGASDDDDETDDDDSTDDEPAGRPQDADPEAARDLEHEWQIAAAQAAILATKAGSVSAGAKRLIQPQASNDDARDVLARYLNFPAETTWARPNRRFIGSGLYLPGRSTSRPGTVVVAIDTSGSIDQRLLAGFAGIVQGIMDGAGWPDQLWVVYCDSRINGAVLQEPGRLDFEACGGGGTAFQPVFDWVAEQNITPDVLCYLTDLECYDTPQDPGYPVIWVTMDWVLRQGPFGETVRIPMER